MSALTTPIEIFYSYENADEPLCIELDKHLSQLRRDSLITTFYKRQIIAGTDWTKVLDEHLNTASVILLLISPDFVASDYSYGREVQHALERNKAGDAYVIPILLRPCDRQGAPFGKLQALPSNGIPVTLWNNQDAAFADIAQGIRAALQNVLHLATGSALTFGQQDREASDSFGEPIPISSHRETLSQAGLSASKGSPCSRSITHHRGSNMADYIGQSMGPYRLLRILGQGSFADVYLGKHLYLKHEVAIKVLYGQLDEDAIEHFLTEGYRLRDLEHPHIMRVDDVGIENGVPFLVMEYAPGGTLRQRYPKGTCLPLPTVVSYVQQIASALDYAHSHKLIHRDLKPENLLLDQNDHVLLSDFGVALPLRHTDSMSVQTIGGTLAYMAPEQIRGKARPQSDQYALAILVYEWLTGSRPFAGGVAELCGQHLFVPPASLCAQVPDLPSTAEQVINKALSKDAGARFAQVSDFASLLDRASRGEEISVPRAVSGSWGATSTETQLLPQPARTPFYNLPAQVTSLIGREAELSAACVLLSRQEVRLLTMTGPGGIGKTTLALACGSSLLSAFRDGTCFVELAAISDPDQVVPTLIQTLGTKEQCDLPPIISLKQVLHDKHLLLVLDNFEQVLDAAPLLLELLQGCPELKMLVTSRAVLHVPGEYTFPVPPLALPDPLQTETSALSANASITLFVERARALKPEFQITDANAPVLVSLCQQLDGLPLALELAAARITHLSPQQLLMRLSRRLDLLARKNSAVPTRQQTIRQAIQWSYDLLEPQEQLLLSRLAVFVGGCQMNDIEALSTHLGDDSDQVLDGVASLIDKSLIFQKEQEEAEPRLHQLEIIREFSRERLEAFGALERTRAAHAQRYASLVVPVPEPAQIALAQGEQLTQLKREYQNLLAALHFFLEKQEMEQALQLVAGMSGIWFVNGYGSSGQEEMERLLTRYQETQVPVSPALYAMALTLIGRMCIYNADLEQAVHWYRKSLALSRTLPDKPFLALTIAGLAMAEGDLGNYAEVDALNAEGIPLLRQIGEKGVLARFLLPPSMLWLRRGILDQAKASAEEGVQIARAIGGQQWALACLLHVLGWTDYLQQDFPSAHALGQESVALFRQLSFPVYGLEALATFASETAALGDRDTAQTLFEEHRILSQEAGDTAEIGRALCGLGYLALADSDLAKAKPLFEESIRTLLQIRQLATRFTHILASSLEGLAAIACAQEQPVRATWLLGTADALRHTGEYTNPLGREVPFWENTKDKVINTLGVPAFSRAFAEGSRMTVLQVVATQEPEKTESEPLPSAHEVRPSMDTFPSEASTELSPRPDGRLPSSEHLTRGEVDVLRLLAQELTNAEIAEQLVLSRVTVNSYLCSIYSKLGVSSRTGATRYALDHHLIS